MVRKIPWAAAAPWLLACHPQGPAANYALSGAPFAARIEADFSAARPGNAREYRSRLAAAVHLRRVDTAAGIAVEISVDSISFSSSERDSGELAFMREGLRRYRATWRMAGDGRVFDLAETPELPRGEFIYRLGPLLAASLPVFSFPAPPADTQSLFDPAAPGAVLIQIRAQADQKAGGGRVRGERWYILRLPGSGAAGTELTGAGDFRFDAKSGFLRELRMELSGEVPADSGAALGVEFKFGFEAASPHP